MSNTSTIKLVARSKNTKLGNKVIAIYTPVKQSCPASCKLKNNGCYAQVGNVGIHNNKMEKNAKKLSPLELAREEARLIKGLDKSLAANTYMRIHVSGDSRTKKGTELIAKAVDSYLSSGGKAAWTYTHAWKHVPRASWGSVSVLASCDNIRDARQALKAGYAPAVVVSEFPNGDKSFKAHGVKFIPCPNQTRERTCEQCKLCFDAEKLKKQKAGIAFHVHGVASKKMTRLKVINVLES